MLFGNDTESVRRTELVILLTPRAVQGADAARSITEEFRRKMEGLKPFYSPSDADADADADAGAERIYPSGIPVDRGARSSGGVVDCAGGVADWRIADRAGSEKPQISPSVTEPGSQRTARAGELVATG